MREFITVDPATLHLPTGIRSQGADPVKLARQIALHGNSLDGMPPLELVRGKDGPLRINDGVTRATRAAKLRCGTPRTSSCCPRRGHTSVRWLNGLGIRQRRTRRGSRPAGHDSFSGGEKGTGRKGDGHECH